MTRSNRNNNPNKRNRRRKRRNGNAGHKAKIGRQVLNSQCYAFSAEALGAKQYDSSSSVSSTCIGRELRTISTDANGCIAFQCTTLPAEYYRNAGTIVGEAVTAFNSWSTADDFAHIDDHIGFRVVSAGVRITVLSNSDNSQGWIRLNSASNLHNSPEFKDYDQTTRRLPIKPGAEYTWMSKPVGPKYHDYLPTDITNTLAVADGGLPTTILDVFVAGGPASTAVLGVEFITHYELLPEMGNPTHSRIASKANTHSPGVVDKVKQLYNDHPHVVEAGEMLAVQAGITKSGILDSIGGFFSGLMESAPALIEDAGMMLI